MSSNTDCDTLHLLLCTICLQEFEESGDHIPRLLPCTHTLCEVCVKQLIQDNRLECPECRAKHEAKKEEKSFPQNKYLLMHIKRKPTKREAERTSKELCVEHKKELVLFCKEPECLKPVCVLCLKNYHRRHDVVGIEDAEGDVLIRKINFIEKNLKEKIVLLNTVKYDIRRKAEDYVNVAERRKEEIKREIEKEFYEIMKDAEKQQKLVTDSVENEIVALNENLRLLSSIRKNEDKSFRDTMDKLEILKGVTETVNRHLSGERTYIYPEFLSAIFTPIEFNQWDDMKFILKLSEIDENTTLLETPMRKITHASQLKCTGKQT